MKKRTLTLNDLSKEALIGLLKAVQIRPFRQEDLAILVKGDMAGRARKHYDASVELEKVAKRTRGKAGLKLVIKAHKKMKTAQRLINEIETISKLFPCAKEQSSC